VEQRPPARKVHLAPEPRDENLDDVAHGIEVVVPDVFQNLPPALHPARMPEQELEQGKLAPGEPNGLATPPDYPASRVELQIGQVKDDVERRPRAPGKRATPSQQLLHREGLGQIIVGPRVETSHPLGERIPGRKHKDRGGAAAAPMGAANAVPIDLRQPDVEERQVVVVHPEGGHRLGARGGQVGRPRRFPHHPEQEIPERGVVFHDENAHAAKNLDGLDDGVMTVILRPLPKQGPLPGPEVRMSQPLVGIVMGSDSDWEIMQHAAAQLAGLGVPHETRVVSAHRTPDLLYRYAEEAAGRGLQCIIAGAGGAAHLPGMLAAKTPVPVLGVPVPSKHLNGLDSLLSIVQMPGGIPVATFAIGEAGAKNAGLFAVALLARHDPALAAKLDEFRKTQTDRVLGLKLPEPR